MTDPSRKVRQLGDKVFDTMSKDWSRLWVVGAIVILAVVTKQSCISLEPGHVAVRVNNVTGSQTTLTRPGLVMRLPFGVHSVYIVDASPQTFSMKGETNVDELNVRELTVRASDGSNFIFKDTTVIFRVLGDETQPLLRDSGQGRGFRNWMRPYVRSVLRDEFGRESTISVSNPANFGEATERARQRLNDALSKHGIMVSNIVTPRPRFTEDYENLIEARNEAENQLTVIRSELARAATERERRLAEVDRDQNRIIQEKKAEFETALATAVTQQAQVKRAADTARIEKVSVGQAALSAAERQSEELRGELQALYATRKAEIDAFRNQPVERVMERLGERLENVTISIQPWASDATPARVDVKQLGGGQ